jgi:hypothetical protein
MDQLAQRWSTDPERLDEMKATTIARGLAFQSMEAQAVKRTGGPGG